MAIDPNIALGVKPLEVANPLAQYGQIAQLQNMQTQNQLHQMQMREAEATAQERNALRQLNPSAPDYEQQLFRVNPQLGIAFRREANTAAAQEATRQKSLIEAAAAKQGMLSQAYRDISSRPSDANIMAHTEDIQASPLFSETEKQKALATQQTLLAMPLNERGAYLASQGAKSSELKPSVHIGPSGAFATPAFGGAATPVTGAEGAFQMTPAQIAANRIAQQQVGISQGNLAVNQAQLALAQENAAKPVFNAATGGFVSPPTKANPQGAFTPVTGIQETKDQQAAVKALKSAGYDPTTGEDNISKLIAKSTSGGLQAGTAAALAFFGKSTEGRKAIAALEGTANQIATDLAGGKLGAGISNTDRDFIVGALGDVSNPMKTSAERLAGWTAAKNRMVSAGVIPAPAGAPAAPNLDALLNKYK